MRIAPDFLGQLDKNAEFIIIDFINPSNRRVQAITGNRMRLFACSAYVDSSMRSSVVY